jgi:hypothetical protein
LRQFFQLGIGCRIGEQSFIVGQRLARIIIRLDRIHDRRELGMFLGELREIVHLPRGKLASIA